MAAVLSLTRVPWASCANHSLFTYLARKLGVKCAHRMNEELSQQEGKMVLSREDIWDDWQSSMCTCAASGKYFDSSS